MLTFLSGHEALKVYCFLWNVVENQKKENLSEGQINRKHSDKHVNIFSEMSKNKVKISIMKSFFSETVQVRIKVFLLFGLLRFNSFLSFQVCSSFDDRLHQFR